MAKMLTKVMSSHIFRGRNRSVPKRSNGTVSKTVGSAFPGSNPGRPATNNKKNYKKKDYVQKVHYRDRKMSETQYPNSPHLINAILNGNFTVCRNIMFDHRITDDWADVTCRRCLDGRKEYEERK